MANPNVFIITGKQGEGKTTRLKEVVDLIQKSGKTVVGFVAVGSWKAGKRNAFTILNIQTGESILLCSDSPTKGWQKEGRFFFNPAAIAMGEKWLGECEALQADFAVIDEIGKFELDRKVWHQALQQRLKSSRSKLIITVRERILDQIVSEYALLKPGIFPLKMSASAIVEKLGERL